MDALSDLCGDVDNNTEKQKNAYGNGKHYCVALSRPVSSRLAPVAKNLEEKRATMAFPMFLGIPTGSNDAVLFLENTPAAYRRNIRPVPL